MVPDDDDDEEDEPVGFKCPYCKSKARPLVTKKISGAGWIVFALMILFCFPLFWIGLLMTEESRSCGNCGMKLG